MGNEYASGVHLVLALKGKQSEIWAAATPRSDAVRAVQAVLGEGWKALRIIPSHLLPDRVALLKLRPNDVRRLTDTDGTS